MHDFRIHSDLSPPSLINNKAAEIKQESCIKTFGTILKDSINEVNRLQSDADKSITKVHTDKSASLHEAVIAMEKSSIAFRTMLSIRNKIIEGYQEIMRMQV